MSMPLQDNTSQRKKAKPLRVKHVPVRTCVSCRESGFKRGLTRIVRTPEGDVRIDPTGKLNGRGAYVCEKASCWDRVIATPLLWRALNVQMTPETLEIVKEHAASHSSIGEARDDAADVKEPG